MKILIVNCGSSSIKYKLYNFPKVSLIAKGLIERIGEEGSRVVNHSQGIKVLVSDILKSGAISDLKQISAIGHRVVHGAETFREPHIIDKNVLKKIRECTQLAPLHNPANLAGIAGCMGIFANVPQVAVFDTAFHQSIPEYAYMYAVPVNYYSRYKIRRYGFHGTSHQFIAQRAAKILKRPLRTLKLITCHLGNGCSITAVKGGKSVDTSMGFTPLEGLMMGTRSGDIDVAAVFHLMKKEKLSIPEMDEILNKKSGLLGISGLSNDFRLIRKAKDRGNRLAKLAYDMFLYRIKKYIGAYYFALGGADAVCFTGGIGEHASVAIEQIKKDIARITGVKTRVLVIPTDEELMIATLTYRVVRSHRPRRR
jgi:acetate kinase